MHIYIFVIHGNPYPVIWYTALTLVLSITANSALVHSHNGAWVLCAHCVYITIGHNVTMSPPFSFPIYWATHFSVPFRRYRLHLFTHTMLSCAANMSQYMALI